MVRPVLFPVLLAACAGDPPPQGGGALHEQEDADTDAGADDTAAPGDDTAATDDTAEPAPLPASLLANGSFEARLDGWEVVEGRCEVTASHLAITPYDGGAFFFGGGGTPGSCLAAQVVGLPATDAIDAGTVAADLEAMVATRSVLGDFDDQPRMRVVWLDAAGASLGSLETLVGSGDAWHVRGATGLVPPGARSARVEAEARFRRNPDNDAMIDAASLTLRAVEAVDPAITRQPLLQDVRADAMRLSWETDGNLADHAVSWGASALDGRLEPVRTIEVDAGHYVHIAELTGLAPDTVYQYAVESGGTLGDTYTLHTAPAADAPTAIAFLADNQEGYDRFATHVRHMAARAPDLLVVAGDLVSDMHSLDEWRDFWWEPLQEADFGSTTPVMIARGNHDRHHPYAYAYTVMPEDADFFSFRYGSVFVVVLDSQEPMANQPDGMDQAAFLEAELQSEAARTADYRVLVMHQPFFTNVRQDSSDGNAGARQVWLPIVEANHVELVVAGHYHSYQRGELNGVQHVIVGGGGSHLLRNDAEDLWEHMTLLERQWHYSIMEVEEGHLVWTTYDFEDEVLDRFELSGGPVE